jgi:predicted DNA-binding protein (MmcQ/YjbR family)
MTRRASPSRATDPFLERLRELCLALPQTRETFRLGYPEFRVGGALFCAYDARSLRRELTVRVPVKIKRLLLSDRQRFTTAPWVGRIGWVSLKVGPSPSWLEIEWLVTGSHWLVARGRDA